MGVIITGLLTVLGLIVRSINVGTLTKNELVATMLAQEAIEAARSIRDSNGLEIEAGKRLYTEWDHNLYFCDAPDTDGLCPDTSTRDYTGVLEQSFDYDSCGAGVPARSCITTSVWVMDFSPDTQAQARVYQHTDASLTPGLFAQRAAGQVAYLEPTAFTRLVTTEPLCDSGGDPVPLQDMAGVTLGPAGLSEAPPCPTEKIGVRVTADISWLEQGNSEHVTLQEDMYDWR